MGSIVDQKNVQKSCCINTCLDLVIVLCLLLVLQVAGGGQQQSCDKSRKVFTSSWGVISDSDGTTNYTKVSCVIIACTIFFIMSDIYLFLLFLGFTL